MKAAKLNEQFKVEQIIILPDSVKGREAQFVTEILQLTGNFVFDVDDTVSVGDAYDRDTGEFTRQEQNED